MKSKAYLSYCLVIIVSLIISTLCILGIKVYHNSSTTQTVLSTTDSSQEVSASIEAESEDSENIEEIDLTTQLNAYIEENELEDQIAICVSDFTSIVYEYNADTNFIAASTYKVPLAMIYYEKVNQGEIALTDEYVYEASHYEEGGPVGDSYDVGSSIDLETLLYYMIFYSDNTAAHILFENLGGWIQFKTLCLQYTNLEVDDAFLSYQNVFTARYMNDVMTYLYENRSSFTALIEDMEAYNGYGYLSQYVDAEIAQKYGYYETAVNSVGIVFSDEPYSIVIYTSLGATGVEHIGKINEICYTYFSSL